MASLAAMRALGVQHRQPTPTHVMIQAPDMRGSESVGRAPRHGQSGTAMRLFTGLLSAQSFDSQLVGDASLMKRPMERVAQPLRLTGADARTRKGTPPVDIVGAALCRGSNPGCRSQTPRSNRRTHAPASYARGPTTIIALAASRTPRASRRVALCGPATDGLRITLRPPRRHASQRSPCRGGFFPAAFFLVAGLLVSLERLLIENVGFPLTRTGFFPRSMGRADRGRERAGERSGAGRGFALTFASSVHPFPWRWCRSRLMNCPCSPRRGLC